MEKIKITKYNDIGEDFTEEQLKANDRALDSMKELFDKMTPEEKKVYLKELKKDIEAAKHPIKLL